MTPWTSRRSKAFRYWSTTSMMARFSGVSGISVWGMLWTQPASGRAASAAASAIRMAVVKARSGLLVNPQAGAPAARGYTPSHARTELRGAPRLLRDVEGRPQGDRPPQPRGGRGGRARRRAGLLHDGGRRRAGARRRGGRPRLHPRPARWGGDAPHLAP